MPERSRGRGCKNHGRGSSVPAERMAGGGGFTGGERGADGENGRIDFHPSARALILEKSARAVLPLDPAVVPPPIPARPGQRSHALARGRGTRASGSTAPWAGSTGARGQKLFMAQIEAVKRICHRFRPTTLSRA